MLKGSKSRKDWRGPKRTAENAYHLEGSRNEGKRELMRTRGSEEGVLAQLVLGAQKVCVRLVWGYQEKPESPSSCCPGHNATAWLTEGVVPHTSKQFSGAT